MKKQSPNTHDLTQAPYTTYGIGPKRGNPNRCIRCAQRIRPGEAWQKDASAIEPAGHGRIVIIQHSASCPNKKGQTRVRKTLAGGRHRRS